MELKKFIADFTTHIEDLQGDLDSGTEFKKLQEWDSMNALAIIAMIDKVYNKQITGDQIESANTIEDLFNIALNS